MDGGILDDKWKVTSVPPTLRDNEVHIWHLDLNQGRKSLNSFFDLLSDDEKHRAERFVFARNKEYFITGRGTLRKVLGGYLDKSPEALRFSLRHYGKPDLSNGNSHLRFNVSHSHGMAVIAVALNREVGVDIEFVNFDFDVSSVARNVFSAGEYLRFEALSPNGQVLAFFAAWTRKEALLKALGDGLSSSDELQAAVSFVSDADVLYRSFENNKSTDWSLTSFSIHDDFKAALVVEGKIGAISRWKLPDGQD
ncbi:MAG: 4'-phosphopantetheinyl transferase superfamily protein [Acidobacteriota bacterium]